LSGGVGGSVGGAGALRSRDSGKVEGVLLGLVADAGVAASGQVHFEGEGALDACLADLLEGNVEIQRAVIDVVPFVVDRGGLLDVEIDGFGFDDPELQVFGVDVDFLTQFDGDGDAISFTLGFDLERLLGREELLLELKSGSASSEGAETGEKEGMQEQDQGKQRYEPFHGQVPPWEISSKMT